MKIKNLIATISAILLVTISSSHITSKAAPEDATTTTAATTVSTVDSTTSEIENTSTETTSDINWQEIKDTYEEDILKKVEEQKKKEKKTPVDYYTDPYYDTDGNAELIDSKVYKVIYSSTELLFTAVTTKDGHVFYILINYADEDGEDNVYFLNNVRNTYGHYKLLE